MVDESRLDDLYEVYTRLNSIAEDITEKDIKNELQGLADLYKEEYEELQEEEEKQWDDENRQRDIDSNAGRI